MLIEMKLYYAIALNECASVDLQQCHCKWLLELTDQLNAKTKAACQCIFD